MIDAAWTKPGEMVARPEKLAEAERLQESVAYRDYRHPQHKETVQMVNRAYRAAYGEEVKGQVGPLAKLKEAPELTREERGYLEDAEKCLRHPAYLDEKHPQHKEAVETARNFFVATYGTAEELEQELGED
jgi:hypothetical protein